MTQQSPGGSRAGDAARSFAAVAFGTVGGLFVVVGAFLILLAFTVLDWFRAGFIFSGAHTHSSFQDLHDVLEATKRQAAAADISGHVSFGDSELYFSWLGWLLFLAAVGLGALAVSSIGARIWAVRWLGAVVCATGAGLTFLALNLITFEGNARNNANAPTYSSYLSHSSVGAWSAITGFVLILIGCLVPQRSR